jgi:uncharacterized membrane protein YcaP (DUF421 family)
VSPGELILRGTLICWFLFLVPRFVLSRDTGSAGFSDILFLVLPGDAVHNGMIGTGQTVADMRRVRRMVLESDGSFSVLQKMR